jgi:hypothetical protein
MLFLSLALGTNGNKVKQGEHAHQKQNLEQFSAPGGGSLSLGVGTGNKQTHL